MDKDNRTNTYLNYLLGSAAIPKAFQLNLPFTGFPQGPSLTNVTYTIAVLK